MKKIGTGLVVLMLVCLALSPLMGESRQKEDPVKTYISALRGELSNGKANLINDVMKLSVREAAVFWPIYQDYETELFALGDRRLEMIGKFSKIYNEQKLDDAQAGQLAKEWFQLQDERLALYQTYSGRLSKELSAVQAVQFVQMENRINTVIDVMIASELPLIQRPDGSRF